MYGKNLKLVLMVMLLLVSKSTFSQVTERERPKEWSHLVLLGWKYPERRRR